MEGRGLAGVPFFIYFRGMRFIPFVVFFSLILSNLSYGQKPAFAVAPPWAAHGSVNYDLTNSRLIGDARDGYMNLVHEVQVNLSTRTTYQRTVVRILTAAGIQKRSEVSVAYDPSYQHLFFHKEVILILSAGFLLVGHGLPVWREG